MSTSYRGLYTIGCQVQVIEKVVRQGLLNVYTIELKRPEHQTYKNENSDIDLPDQSMLFTPRPPCGGIKTVNVFPALSLAWIRRAEEWSLTSPDEADSPGLYQGYRKHSPKKGQSTSRLWVNRYAPESL